MKVNFFLHEQFESELDEVARAFRLETQIIETDKYDVHMVRDFLIHCRFGAPFIVSKLYPKDKSVVILILISNCLDF